MDRIKIDKILVSETCPECGCGSAIKSIHTDTETGHILSEHMRCASCKHLISEHQYEQISLGNPYSPTVKCPYCGSTNTKKIGFGTKAAHTALFGVFAAGKVSKEWHCNNCKSDF